MNSRKLELKKCYFNSQNVQVPSVGVSPKPCEKVDAVVLDEESVGPAVDAPSGLGIGAKVLRGKGSFDAYLSQTQVLLFSFFSLGPSISYRHM